MARAIHQLSGRRDHAFVKLNCAAIPTGLLESELFGHEKGAFTGAISQRIGRFELANRGTVFLDEVGEIPLELQPKLLRVLQEREFERLGSTRTLRTDARLIAATNRDLAAMADEQKFRQDLFYRLNVFPITVPPLRERREDIPMLVRHFAQQFARRMKKNIDTIPSETLESLTRYDWPGNIRELQNLIERAVILSPGPTLNVPVEGLTDRGVSSIVVRARTLPAAPKRPIKRWPPPTGATSSPRSRRRTGSLPAPTARRRDSGSSDRRCNSACGSSGSFGLGCNIDLNQGRSLSRCIHTKRTQEKGERRNPKIFAPLFSLLLLFTVDTKTSVASGFSRKSPLTAINYDDVIPKRFWHRGRLTDNEIIQDASMIRWVWTLP